MNTNNEHEPTIGSDSSPPTGGTASREAAGVLYRINRALLAWGRWMDGRAAPGQQGSTTAGGAETMIDPAGRVLE
jgi:hypothetical protein